MKTETKSNWQKCPSVCREGKYFYYNAVSGHRVMQSFQDDSWRGENNMGLCLCTATDAKDCMAMIDGNL